MPEEYPCPCCGYLVFNEPAGSGLICPICAWDDDIRQLRWPLDNVGRNGVSLLNAQANYQAMGAVTSRLIYSVRNPTDNDSRDPDWRPVDPTSDHFETWDVDDRSVFPEDGTKFYYWRATYGKPAG